MVLQMVVRTRKEAGYTSIADGFFSADARQMMPPGTMAGITGLVKTTVLKKAKENYIRIFVPSKTMNLRNPNGVKVATVQPPSGSSPCRNGAGHHHPATAVKQSKNKFNQACHLECANPLSSWATGKLNVRDAGSRY